MLKIIRKKTFAAFAVAILVLLLALSGATPPM